MERPKRRFQFNGEVTPAPEPVEKPKASATPTPYGMPAAATCYRCGGTGVLVIGGRQARCPACSSGRNADNAQFKTWAKAAERDARDLGFDPSSPPKVFQPARDFTHINAFQIAFLCSFLPVVAHEMIRKALNPLNGGANDPAAIELKMWMDAEGYELKGVLIPNGDGISQRYFKIYEQGKCIAIAQIPYQLLKQAGGI
jgi:hypothetical protein